MASNSEARKAHQLEAERRERVEAFAALAERRRDVMVKALGEVYAGAGYVEADAVLDHLGDLGASVSVVEP